MGEIAKELDVPEEDVVLALEAIQDPVSPVRADLSTTAATPSTSCDQVRDDPRHTRTTSGCENLAIREALRAPERARAAHPASCGSFEGRTQMEVAGEIGISQAQVSRLEKNALQHMRKYVSES